MQCSNCNAVMDDYCRVLYHAKSSQSTDKSALLCRCPRCRTITIVELNGNGEANGKVLYSGKEYLNEALPLRIPINATRALHRSISKITSRLH